MRGVLAATVAGSAVLLTALAVVQSAFFAPQGAHLLIVAPAAGLVVAVAVFGALQRFCRSGSGPARGLAIAGIAVLFPLAVLGVSFGGLQLLLPALLLAVAAALTPRPAGTVHPA